MQWARQRVDARRNRGIQVGVGGTGDTYHGSGAVLLMIGMNDQQASERMHVQRVGIERLVRHRKAHAQEIVDIAARIIRIQHRLIAATAENVADDGSCLCHNDGRSLVKLVGIIDISSVRIEGGERVDRGCHHAHRMRGAWERTHEGTEILTHHRAMVDVGNEPVVLLLIRQFAMTQQPGDLKEIGLLTQLLDRVPAVAQDRVLAVDVRDFRFALRSRQETRVECDPAVVAQRGHHDAVRTRRGFDHRQGEVFGFHTQIGCGHTCTLLNRSKVSNTIWHARFQAWFRLKINRLTSDTSFLQGK